MKNRNWTDIALWGVAAALLVAVCVLAVADAPDFVPVGVVYSEGIPPAEEPSSPSSQMVESRVNINTANLEELMTLPGIGEITGQKIIDYRERYGGFDTVEELMEISGIGEKKFEAIRDRIVV